ncbi:MAG TPA: flagellar assembly peptidoglycan hydrolase FlgJ [Gammaproteobacteria bacterium]|nr:flagellar assembly peptidoglycan hydrolase FlgJ [Gammaproteobacteria bacterium]
MTNTVPSAVDMQGLAELKQRAAHEDPKALAQAAVQFEALFIGMMLKSARDASLGSGILDGQESKQYLELMDQQVALELAQHGGFGFGKLIVDQLGGDSAPSTDGGAGGAGARPGAGAFALPHVSRAHASPVAPPLAASSAEATAPPAADGTPESFVARFLDDATAAANALGVEPRLLLAQAALETGWGAAAPAHADGKPSNNLFGIKAGSSWRGARVAQWTIEHEDGVAARKREDFRAYGNAADSFADYVHLIGSSPRYAAALDQAQDAEGFARAVTAAGYATDPDYAEKWLAVYHGDTLGGALDGLKPAAAEPTEVTEEPTP